MLTREEWRAAAEAHRAEAEAELADVIRRRREGEQHPVEDFLFHYYNLRPGQLTRWYPGIGVEVEDDGSWPAPDYRVTDGRATVDADHLRARRGRTLRQAAELLRASDRRPPRFACHGMHEWAMVLGLAPHETRHPYLPLRYAPGEIRDIVTDVGCCCSHVDAFRFFTPEASPLNALRPTRERQAHFDQPGCLHVNMDLYKWAGKLLPATSSSLLMRTFRLAREIREVDMRASAYDLTGWGYAPIPVETEEGRDEYVRLQRDFARRSVPLRHELITVLERLGVGTAPREEAVAT